MYTRTYGSLFAEELDRHPEELQGFKSESFFNVLKQLDENRTALIESGLSPNTLAAIKLMKLDIIAMEEVQEVPRFLRWNVTVYQPKDEHGEYSYQFCSPPPDCTRIFLTYESGQPKLTITEACIEAHPDLKKVIAWYGDGTMEERKPVGHTLEETIDQLDEIRIQRIGIVGFARNFPDICSLELSDTLGPEQLQMRMRYRKRAQYASEAIDSFLEQYRRKGVAYTTVNGGWAGQNQNPREVGVPFMANLYGIVHESEDVKDYAKGRPVEDSSSDNEYDIEDTQQNVSPPDFIHHGFYPPLTVMPTGGSSDAVHTVASLPNFVKEAIEHNFACDTIGSRTQHIVEGDWGTDSPFLAALSTSMVVIEPAGRWTQIEMLNAMEQGRPIVILASPENYNPEWLDGNKVDEQYIALADEAVKFVEIALPTKSDLDAKVRAYRDPADAADWLAWRYEVDHLPGTLPAFLKDREGQRFLIKLIKILRISDEDAFNEAVQDEIISKYPQITEQDSYQLIKDVIQNMEKRHAIEKLSDWICPDNINSNFVRFSLSCPSMATSSSILFAVTELENNKSGKGKEKKQSAARYEFKS